MPIFYQQDIDESTKLAVWKIEEGEDFFLQHVPLHREITHPHKRLQHLAGRYLLQFLFPDFPISLIKIAGTQKPFLDDEAYHFSISHCSNYAAAIVSKWQRVGVDIEVPTFRVERIKHKFLSEEEWETLYRHWLDENNISDNIATAVELLTLVWCSKEAIFKWWGSGDVDFKTMLHVGFSPAEPDLQLAGMFSKENLIRCFPVSWKNFPGLLLTWVATSPDGQGDAAANAKPFR